MTKEEREKLLREYIINNLVVTEIQREDSASFFEFKCLGISINYIHKIEDNQYIAKHKQRFKISTSCMMPGYKFIKVDEYGNLIYEEE